MENEVWKITLANPFHPVFSYPIVRHNSPCSCQARNLGVIFDSSLTFSPQAIISFDSNFLISLKIVQILSSLQGLQPSISFHCCFVVFFLKTPNLGSSSNEFSSCHRGWHSFRVFPSSPWCIHNLKGNLWTLVKLSQFSEWGVLLFLFSIFKLIPLLAMLRTPHHILCHIGSNRQLTHKLLRRLSPSIFPGLPSGLGAFSTRSHYPVKEHFSQRISTCLL